MKKRLINEICAVLCIALAAASTPTFAGGDEPLSHANIEGMVGAPISSQELFERAFTLMRQPDSQVTVGDVEAVLGGKIKGEVNEINRVIFLGPSGTNTEIILDRNLEPIPMGRGTFSIPSIKLLISFMPTDSAGACLDIDTLVKELRAQKINEVPPLISDPDAHFEVGDLSIRFDRQARNQQCVSGLVLLRSFPNNVK